MSKGTTTHMTAHLANIKSACSWRAFMTEAILKIVDANGDGKIDRNEMKNLMRVLDPAVWTEEKVDVLFSEVAEDTDGKLDLPTFLAWISEPGKNQNAVRAAANAVALSQSQIVAVPEADLKALLLVVKHPASDSPPPIEDWNACYDVLERLRDSDSAFTVKHFGRAAAVQALDKLGSFECDPGVSLFNCQAAVAEVLLMFPDYFARSLTDVQPRVVSSALDFNEVASYSGFREWRSNEYRIMLIDEACRKFYRAVEAVFAEAPGTVTPFVEELMSEAKQYEPDYSMYLDMDVANKLFHFLACMPSVAIQQTSHVVSLLECSPKATSYLKGCAEGVEVHLEETWWTRGLLEIAAEVSKHNPEALAGKASVIAKFLVDCPDITDSVHSPERVVPTLYAALCLTRLGEQAAPWRESIDMILGGYVEERIMIINMDGMEQHSKYSLAKSLEELGLEAEWKHVVQPHEVLLKQILVECKPAAE